jgi:hypothetical protein
VTSRPTRPSTEGAAEPSGLGNTWPLFGEPSPRFPKDPVQNVTPFRPDPGELEALERQIDLPETTEQAEVEIRRLRDSLPPVAEEWARAARALVDWLNERLARGDVDAIEQATIARTWAAFALGGVTPPQVLRVAHVVSRAHSAIREVPRNEQQLQAAFQDCAGVLHAGLPRAVRERMPLERAVQIVRGLHREADPWSAVVEGTAELLGWKDYARAHAASVIRAVIEKGR